MGFFRRMFFFLIINLFVVLTAVILATIVSQVFGIEGEWSFYIIFYSIIGFGGAFLSLFISKWAAKKFMGVKIISPHSAQGQEREILEMTTELARKARLPKTPEVGIFENPQVNAFATGPSKRNSLVAVSRGAINALDKEELEGVLGHEVAHIANGDMVTMTLLTGMMNVMVLLAARFVAKIIVSQQRQRSFWMEHLIFIGLHIVFSIFAMIVLNAFSRKREYRADAGGAKLAGSGNMIKALEALKRAYSPKMLRNTGNRFQRQQESYQYLQISGKQKVSLFSTHPPLESRIERLKRRYA